MFSNDFSLWVFCVIFIWGLCLYWVNFIIVNGTLNLLAASNSLREGSQPAKREKAETGVGGGGLREGGPEVQPNSQPEGLSRFQEVRHQSANIWYTSELSYWASVGFVLLSPILGGRWPDYSLSFGGFSNKFTVFWSQEHTYGTERNYAVFISIGRTETKVQR